jgi:hypothetical protein
MEMKEYTVSATLRAGNLNHFEGDWEKRPVVAGYEYNPIIDWQRLFVKVPVTLVGQYSRAGTRH